MNHKFRAIIIFINKLSLSYKIKFLKYNNKFINEIIHRRFFVKLVLIKLFFEY